MHLKFLKWDLLEQNFDWKHSVYGDAHDIPEPLGEAVTTTTTMDSSLNHCLATGKSLTGCLHFLKKQSVDWYSQIQALLRQLHMVLSLLLQKQQQSRSWTLGRL